MELVPISSAVCCRADMVHSVCALRDRIRAMVLEDAAPRLATLVRLRGQYISHDLPRRYNEVEVEQPFTAALFGRVLGYRSLFDEGAGTFDICPQRYIDCRRPDFSIGSFGMDGAQIIVSGELKGPGASLDRPQRDRDDKKSAVEQAFEAARRQPDCRWVVLSNIAEMRLYAINDAETPLAVVDLINAYRRDDLLALRAIFGRDTLLPLNGERSKMSLLLDPNHPSQPVPAAAGSCRLVLSFSPSREGALPLYKAEGALRLALLHMWTALRPHIEKAPGLQALFSKDQIALHQLAPPVPVLQAQDGWVCCDLLRTERGGFRVSLSRSGDVTFSGTLVGGLAGAPDRLSVASLEMVGVAFFFLVMELFTRTSASDIPNTGSFSAHLLDARGLQLSLEEPSAFGAFFETVVSSPREGLCPSDTVVAGPFPWPNDASEAPGALSACICEIAAHFRHKNGGVVLSGLPGERLLRLAIEQSRA